MRVGGSDAEQDRHGEGGEAARCQRAVHEIGADPVGEPVSQPRPEAGEQRRPGRGGRVRNHHAVTIIGAFARAHRPQV